MPPLLTTFHDRMIRAPNYSLNHQVLLNAITSKMPQTGLSDRDSPESSQKLFDWLPSIKMAKKKESKQKPNYREVVHKTMIPLQTKLANGEVLV